MKVVGTSLRYQGLCFGHHRDVMVQLPDADYRTIRRKQ